MKKILLILLCISLLSGCGVENSKSINKTEGLEIVEEEIIDNKEKISSEMTLSEIELKLANLELSLLDYEDELSLLKIAKKSYEENIDLAKKLKPTTYETDRGYRESNAKLTQVLYQIEQLEKPINEIKSQMEELKNSEVYKNKNIAEEFDSNTQTGELTPFYYFEDSWNSKTNPNFENYNNKIVTGTMVKGALQNFQGKKMAVLIHTNKMGNKEIKNSININGLTYINYNAIFKSEYFSDIGDGDNIIENSSLDSSDLFSGFNNDISNLSNSDSIEYINFNTKFDSLLLENSQGYICGILFIEI